MFSVQIFFKQKKYFASAFLFTCFNLIFSTWITYIPHIAEKLGITEGRIGSAIFFSALGSFVAIPLSKRVVEKLGVGRSTYFSLVAYSITLLGPLLAPTYSLLCGFLFLFGMMSSWYAISVNSLTATIERQDKVYIMSGSHGFWSLGGVIGASAGSMLVAVLHNPVLHAVVIVSIVLGVQTYLRNAYFSRIGEPAEKTKHKTPIRPLLLIAVMGLIMMVSEGAIADWSALYLKKIVHVNLAYVGLGYAAFSLAMMIGRFLGDALSHRYGSWQLLTFSIALSLGGLLLVLVTYPVLSILGFFVVGLGFSVTVPEVYRLAANLKGIKTSDGVAVIAATTNIGFLVGPVLLGFLAELYSLHISFSVLAVFVSLGFLLAVWKWRRK